MSFCYYKIFREIHVHMDRIRKTSNIDLENSVQQQKKVATTLFLVLACFLLCWTPFVLYSNTAAIIKDKSAVPLILNPLVSPIAHSILITLRDYIYTAGYNVIILLKIFREIHVYKNRIRKTSNIDLENSVQQQKKVQTRFF